MNIMQLQGNEKFKQLVNDWQTKLGTVEAVLGCWGDVQKKWQALESIFIGSADIRVQLPEDSKRFDAINADFQDLMRSAPDVTGVVDACNLEGRDERLNNLLSQLEMCEKALQVRVSFLVSAHAYTCGTVSFSAQLQPVFPHCQTYCRRTAESLNRSCTMYSLRYATLMLGPMDV